MANNRDIEKDSEYPKINVPVFKETIPDSLLQEVSPEMRELLKMASVQEQYTAWLCEKLEEVNYQVRKTNGRLKRVESWKEKLTNWTSVSLAGIVAMGAIWNIAYKIVELIAK